MIEVLFDWLWIAILCYIYGAFFLRFWKRDVSWMNAWVTGIAFLTVYAEIFSMFSKVGMIANLLLAIGAVGIVWKEQKSLSAPVQITKVNLPEYLLFGILLLMVASICAYGELHYDTGLYHASSIHWIEEYGTPLGVANLQKRIGYNSSFFSFTALFSMKWFIGRSLHATTGFIIVLCICYAIHTLFRIPKSKNIVSGSFAIATLAYWLYVMEGAAIPTSDYPSMYLALWIATKWAEQLEKKEEDTDAFALLCIASVYVMTIKLSASMMVLMVLLPAISLIKKKEWRSIIKYILTGCLVILPFLIRNVMVSGWLIYPFTILDLFPVDWKVPLKIALTDAQEIKVWARGTYEIETASMKMREWLPIWWEAQGYYERILLVSNVVAFCYWIVNSVVAVIVRKEMVWREFWFETVLFINVGFWFFQAPLVRYGFAYLLMFPICVMAIEIKRTIKVRGYRILSGLAVIVLLIMTMKYTFFFSRESLGEVRELYHGSEYLIHQRDYDIYETGSEKKDGFLFYYPTDTDQVGYYGFPGTLSSKYMKRFELRGKSLRDGFRMIPK